MTVPGRYTLLACALAALIALPGAAQADCYGCERSPRAPAPPPACGNCAPPAIVIAPPHIPPAQGARISAGSEAEASATTVAISHARAGDTIVRTGAGGFAAGGASAAASASAVALNVAEVGAIETLERSVLIEAACLDAAGGRFHAAQTFAAREVAPDYAGELYRCWADTHLQYVTEDGRAADCAPGHSLWYERDALRCAPQTVRGDANFMLRRFGTGPKLVRLSGARTPTAQPQLTMDGGVGQGVW